MYFCFINVLKGFFLKRVWGESEPYALTKLNRIKRVWGERESNPLPTGLQPDALPMSYRYGLLYHYHRENPHGDHGIAPHIFN